MIGRGRPKYVRAHRIRKTCLRPKGSRIVDAVDCQAQLTDSGVFEADVWLRVGAVPGRNNTAQFIDAD